jgi:threonyl-tRNA synthetase
MPKDSDKKIDIEAMRHSCSHVLAQAVMEMFPDAKLAIGPAIDNGFYYDFDLPRTLIPEDLALIEKKMSQIIKQNQKFVQKKEPVDESIKFLKKTGQIYKVEMAEELKKEGEKDISFYENVMQDGKPKFVDMCKGPHMESTIKIGPFKLTHTAGAYWRGDEKNKMLQRIYGVCFASREELDAHLKMLEEAKRRDHRKLGKDLEIFIFDDDVGPGLPLWMPNGGVIIESLEKLAKKMELEAGYVRVRTPHLAKESMYKKSGHLPYYEDTMFPPMDVDGVKYYLKAMNCPHHHKIFDALPRSYRDLPLRLAEYGTCYRYEKTGELFGLMRVRSLQMNDAHIYCSKEQFADEFHAVNEMYLKYFKIFGIEKYVMRFSTHDPKKLGEKFVDEPKLWKETEDMVRKVLVKTKTPFIEVPNEAAFYGPKIDVQVWSAIGREFTLATNQVDFAVPGRFGLKFINEKGEEETPLCIHRAPLGTHERFIGFLIEHYAGAFPVWLAPVQVAILPVSDKFNDYAFKAAEEFKKAGIRVKVDDSNESLGKKIRKAEMYKIPYMAVVGEKESGSGTLSVRDYATKKQEEYKLGEFVKKAGKEGEVG